MPNNEDGRRTYVVGVGSSRDGGVNRSEGARMLGSRLCLNVSHPLVGDWGEGVVETGGVQMLLGLWRQRERESTVGGLKRAGG